MHLPVDELRRAETFEQELGPDLRSGGSASGDLEAPLRRPEPVWARASGLGHVLSSWREQPLWRSVVTEHVVPGSDARYVPLPQGLAPGVEAALRARGFDRLYAHQAQSFELARTGTDVVVATPTASGKSLCYNLPVVDRIARDPAARALYLFPTKALSRDQEASVRGFLEASGVDCGAVTYDGDTPGDARRSARERAGILISNPDMLHAGILPHHAAWARFFANLAYVVVDELHAYRGVFGSHLANVLRRLQRIASFHGSRPRFLFASATIGNPREHASRLSGREVALIDDSGAPSGSRRFLLYNPPVVNAELGIRASYTKSAVRLATDLLKARVPTIVFGQSRNQVEVMLKYLRDRSPDHGLPAEAIQGYRGGYLPGTRRRIEEGLRSGKVGCVVATSALELGIDIGALDAVICAGYPGSVAGMWQRFGRAGRRESESLALLVTSSAPLDQFLAREPDHLVGAPVEHARIDPDNVDILIQHLKCAAFELPFVTRDDAAREDASADARDVERNEGTADGMGDGMGDVPAEAVQDALEFLGDNGVVQAVHHEGKRTFHWSSDAYPANAVSLRSPSWDNFVIIDVERTRTIAEMDFRSAHTMLHEQAIYQHDGEQYQVERLDFDNHKGFVRKVAPDYYTTAMTHTKVNVLYESRSELMSWGQPFDLNAGLGDVNVVSKVVGYKKIKFHTHENVGYGEVQLPEMQLPTTALWLKFPADLVLAQPVPRPVVIDALRGLAVALETVAALGLMTDPRDIRSVLVDDPQGASPNASGPGGDPVASAAQRRFDPTLYLYDAVAGGVGLAPRLFEERRVILGRARRLLESCPCAEGCPACVGPVVSGAGIMARKLVAAELLNSLGVGSLH